MTATELHRIAGTIPVCFASPGRFHAFDVGRQLHRLGCLRRFYTGYPKWKVPHIPGHVIASLPWLVAPSMLLRRYGLVGFQKELDWVATATFDSWVARRLEECQIFQFLSGSGLRSQRVAKRRYRAVVVCDHGSTHILHQTRVVEEEHARWNIPYRPLFSGRFIARELEEYEEADIILVPSSVALRSFLEQGVAPSKIRKLPYGVDLELFRPAEKRDSVFRVIYVGVLNLRKGLPYLLEALAPLRLPNFELWLVGQVDDQIRFFLRRYEGSYRLFGYVARSQLYRYYSQASIFAIASIEEGLATVQAQAMACGLPVIATECTGAEDLLSDGVEGFIVPARDAEAIREKVLLLYHRPELRDQMGKAALQRVRQLQGWNSYGQALMAIYREAIASSG